MALFDNEAEKKRKQNLQRLEDKRLALAQAMEKAGLTSEKALYGQTGGGFHGIAVCGDQFLYLTGPGPADEDMTFTYAVHPSVDVRVEDILIKGEGLGGMLGFGKKGGTGFRLHLAFPDGTAGDIEVVAGQNCYFENTKGVDPHFSTKRRRSDANVVWDYKPVDPGSVKAILDRWMKALA